MNKLGKIAICIECGFLGDPKSKNRGKKATLKFLKKAQVITWKLKKNEKQIFYKLTRLYKNREGKFKKAREFKDFEQLKKSELIVFDGKKKVYAKKRESIIFVRDKNQLGEECFIKAKKSLINQEKLNKTEQRGVSW